MTTLHPQKEDASVMCPLVFGAVCFHSDTSLLQKFIAHHCLTSFALFLPLRAFFIEEAAVEGHVTSHPT